MPVDITGEQDQAVSMERKILLILSHPQFATSFINRKLMHIANSFPQITVVDLYEEYPLFFIDKDKEQQRIRNHDVILFQYPWQWFSCPSLLQEWRQTVLENDFVFEEEGLKDKVFASTISTHGGEEDYTRGGKYNIDIIDLLHINSHISTRCKMQYLPPLMMLGRDDLLAMDTKGEAINRSEANFSQYKTFLHALVTDNIDYNQVSEADILNGVLKQSLKVKDIQAVDLDKLHKLAEKD